MVTMNKTIRMSVITAAGTAVLLLAGCQCPGTVVRPIVMQPPPAPPREVESVHETLSADALFAFGRSDIRSLTDRGRNQLDQLVAQLRGIRRIHSVSLVGYTDRIGDRAYNDDLSLKRANAVRDYLISHGLDGNLITTEGRGESNPVVNCPQLTGQRLHDCLAPNRRVQVDIAAVR
jgi:outer membrane protein OmpA-like peptidoglycan-associated protein